VTRRVCPAKRQSFLTKFGSSTCGGEPRVKQCILIDARTFAIRAPRVLLCSPSRRGCQAEVRLKEALSGLAGSLLRYVPIASWPSVVSRLTGVLVPKAIAPHKQPSSAGGANIKILLEFLDRTADLEGGIAECGVWRGRTFVAMALYLRQKSIPKTIFGFDSFQGFDASVETDISLGGANVNVKKLRGFDDTSFALVQRKAGAFHLKNFRIEPGFFEESLRRWEGEKFCFVHLDCDLYESYSVCLDFFYPRMVSGGIILFDEYNDPAWPGANRAVDEFLRAKPERPQSITRDNFEKWFVVKT